MKVTPQFSWHETYMSTDQAAAHSRLTSVVWPIQSFGWLRVLEGHNLFCLYVCVSAVNIEAVCADDLLSVILYLLVKTEIPNWWEGWGIHCDLQTFGKKADLSFLVSLTRTDEATPLPLSLSLNEELKWVEIALNAHFCYRHVLQLSRLGNQPQWSSSNTIQLL